MSNPLVNPTTSPKPILGIEQTRIVTNCKEPSDEEKDYFERKHNPKMQQIILIGEPYHD
jgi:hypothetical protein